MIAAFVLAVGFAVASLAAGRWVDRWTRGDQDLWSRFQAGLLFARFAAIFAAAGALWKWTLRTDYVVVFVVTGALGQMVGQIAFWLADERKRNRRNGMGKNA